MRPLVTAIVPTRNRAYCLPRAVESICAQEGRGELFDVEVVVVDDASSDATPDVIRPYEAVRYVRLPENRGVAAALNEGLRVGRGRYVSFLGDDDEWLPHKLRVQVPLLEAHPGVGVVYGQFLGRMGTQEWLFPDAARAPSGQVFAAMLLYRFASHHAALLVRREAFDAAGEFDESLGSYEDYDMSLRLALHGRFLFAPGPVTVYNLSPRGLWLTRATNGEGAADAVRAVERALRSLPDTRRSRRLGQEALACVAFDAASPFATIGDLEQAWARTLGAVRANPWVLGRAWARHAVRSAMERRLSTAADPETVAAALCAQLDAAARGGGMAARRRARRLLADAWVEVAHLLTFGPRPSYAGTRRAACRALAWAPSSLLRKRLLRVMARRGLGRRFDAVVMSAWKRLVRPM
jgi:hypothetical protein